MSRKAKPERDPKIAQRLATLAGPTSEAADQAPDAAPASALEGPPADEQHGAFETPAEPEAAPAEETRSAPQSPPSEVDVPADPDGSSEIPEDVRSLLTELARALHRQLIYPPNHPALRGLSAALAEQVGEIAIDRAEIAIHVGRNQLGVDGALTDSENPALASLARQLHRHHVAALSLAREMEPREISELLTAVAADPPPDETSPLAEQSWPHIRIALLQYDQLELDPDSADSAELPGEFDGVWLALARAALDGKETDAEQVVDTRRVARQIEARCSDESYMRGIAQQLLQVERAIAAAPGRTPKLRQLTSDLVASLDVKALRGLLRVGATAAERRQLLAGAATSLRAGAAVKLLREVTELEETEVPHAVWLMLSKLARYADGGARDQRKQASERVRAQILELLADWDISGSTPTEYKDVLEAMTEDAGSGTKENGRSSRSDVEASRLVQMGIEVERTVGAVRLGFARMVSEGTVAELLDILEDAPADNPAVRELQRQIEDPRILASLLRREATDFETIDRIIDLLGVSASTPLLDAMVESDSRALRSQLFRRVVNLGPEIAPTVAERVDDERWYVRRNMLALLDEFGGSPSGYSAAPYLDDEHEAVRLIAIKLQLGEPTGRDQAIGAALQCGDSRTVILGLHAARDDCPASEVGTVASLALTESNSKEIRMHATRALAGVRAEEALEALLRLARGRRWTFRRRPPRQSFLGKEAIQILRSTWADDPRAANLLRRQGR